MADLDAYSDVVGPDARAVWPLLARAVKNIRGALVGGTALAMHLHHRVSYDLDYMTYKSFSGEHLYRRLRSAAETAVANTATRDQMNAVIDGVAIDVFMAPCRGDNPGHVRQLNKPMIVDGLAVASLPDLLATKLDIIMYRPKLRDYIDIAAIDASGRLRIEDGLALHMQRYGTTLRSQTLDRIIDLLEKPGQLATDRVFAHRQQETLDYLAGRVPQLRSHLLNTKLGITAHQTQPPPRRGGEAPASKPKLKPQIEQLLKSRPKASYAQIADALGTKPSYVAQIAREIGRTRRGARTPSR